MDASLTLTLPQRIRKNGNEKSLQRPLKNLLLTSNHHLHSCPGRNHRYRETNHDQRNSQNPRKAPQEGKSTHAAKI